ncbi:MAG: fibronectin type III domain-containing protein [Treponema sp.]|nr:fibronectin type III domain-containing protein [Treponema sp.]
MKKRFIFIHTVYIFLFVCGSVFAVGEKTYSLGGNATWSKAESRNGVTEARQLRPHPVLILSSAVSSGYSAATGVLGYFTAISDIDMSVSFDERDARLYNDSIGRYRVSASGVIPVDRSFARSGTGAALFGNPGSRITITPQSRYALFAPGNRIGDFTIEFWLYPQNMENGERIFSWVSANSAQSIQCVTSRNRLKWTFTDFFTSTNAANTINIEFSGVTPLVPKTWSHHLIRFDAVTGMLEYITDGICQTINYATRTGRENSEVYTPIAANGSFLLGENFKGLMDDFKIHRVFAGRASVQKYPSFGGRMETGAIDLGDNLSNVSRIDVKGGRAGIISEYRENGTFRFSDASEMNFFIRASENPWLLNNTRWVNFTPGSDIFGIEGRYVQIAVDFYPSADGETTPYLETLNIIYMPGEPPLPPRNVVATAGNGGVQLNWRHSPNANTAGYLVYYSSVRGELFGEDSFLGVSPIDVGMTNSVFIDGLKNGTLYYFRVAGYDRVTAGVPGGKYNAGEFSAEVTARPLAGTVLGGLNR